MHTKMEEETYHNLDIILMANAAGLSAKGNLLVTRVGRANEILAKVDFATVLGVRPDESPIGTSPYLICTHLLKLRAHIGVLIVPISSRDSVIHVGEEFASDGAAERTRDE